MCQRILVRLLLIISFEIVYRQGQILKFWIFGNQLYKLILLITVGLLIPSSFIIFGSCPDFLNLLKIDTCLYARQIMFCRWLLISLSYSFTIAITSSHLITFSAFSCYSLLSYSPFSTIDLTSSFFPSSLLFLTFIFSFLTKFWTYNQVKRSYYMNIRFRQTAHKLWKS